MMCTRDVINASTDGTSVWATKTSSRVLWNKPITDLVFNVRVLMVRCYHCYTNFLCHHAEFAPNYRPDLRCGPYYPGPNGEEGICLGDGIYPCCSNDGWCGNTLSHCSTNVYRDFRSPGKNGSKERPPPPPKKKKDNEKTKIFKNISHFSTISVYCLKKDAMKSFWTCPLVNNSGSEFDSPPTYHAYWPKMQVQCMLREVHAKAYHRITPLVIFIQWVWRVGWLRVVEPWVIP